MGDIVIGSKILDDLMIILSKILRVLAEYKFEVKNKELNQISNTETFKHLPLPTNHIALQNCRCYTFHSVKNNKAIATFNKIVCTI